MLESRIARMENMQRSYTFWKHTAESQTLAGTLLSLSWPVHTLTILFAMSELTHCDFKDTEASMELSLYFALHV